MSYPLFTGGSLQQFRRFELIGRSARRRRRQVLHRTTGDHLVETLDDLRIAAGRPLQLSEPDEDAEADEQDEHEDRAGPHALKSADGDLLDLASTHAPASSRGFGGGMSYQTRPLRTSSIARRSGLWRAGAGCSASKRTRAPRRSCLALNAATSTNRKRLLMGGAGSGGMTDVSTGSGECIASSISTR